MDPVSSGLDKHPAAMKLAVSSWSLQRGRGRERGKEGKEGGRKGGRETGSPFNVALERSHKITSPSNVCFNIIGVTKKAGV